MAKAQSHKIEYKDCEDVLTLIEIWEEGYVGSIVECEAGEDPLSVDIAGMDPTIFVPIIGKGATIKVLSVTNGQFTGLYTLDPVKRMVKVFKNSNANPWWLGYINAEQYSEPYSRIDNYPVTINCNDGFNILNRFKYLNGTANYDTLETKWNVLTRILAKAGLPYQYIYFASKYTEYGITIDADKTIFHHLSVDQNNYYDEQDEPMTYRQVLEAILSSLGLQIRQEGGSIFIYEPQMLIDASFSAKRFNGTTYAYVDTVSVSGNFDISNGDINWDNEDQVLDIRSGFSKQKIRYSPYVPEGAVKEIDVANRYIWTGTETWTADGYGVLRLSGITAITGITYPINVSLTGRKRYTDDPEDIYLERTSWNIGLVMAEIAGYKISLVAGQSVKITGQVFIKTKTDEYNDSLQSVVAGRIEIPVNLIIDTKGLAWNGSYWDWSETYDVAAFRAKAYKAEGDKTICDQWIDFSVELPPWLPGGDAVLKICDPEVYYANVGGSPMDTDDGMIRARFRDLKARIFESSKEITADDVKFEGELDVAFMNEAPEITLFHGNARNITDRAAIRRSNKSYTSLWKKTGDTEYYRLADLLLRSIISQYRDSMEQLSGTLEAGELMTLNGGPKFLFTLQDTDYKSTKKFLFAGGTYNDFKRTLNGSFIEIKPEDLTINLV